MHVRGRPRSEDAPFNPAGRRHRSTNSFHSRYLLGVRLRLIDGRRGQGLESQLFDNERLTYRVWNKLFRSHFSVAAGNGRRSAAISVGKQKPRPVSRIWINRLFG